MTDSCPHCGRVYLVGSDLKVDLNDNTVVIGDRKVQLRPLDAEVLSVIASARSRQPSLLDIFHSVWGDSEVCPSSVRVHVSMLNRHLRPLGYEVGAKHGRYGIRRIAPRVFVQPLYTPSPHPQARRYLNGESDAV